MAISTRLHGVIDHGVALALGGLAGIDVLPRPVRWLLGSAAAGHAGYSLVTDYEAGLRALLSMRRHLQLDAAVAAALLGAGLLMRRQGAASRVLLLGIGVAELAVVAASSDRAESGPGHRRPALSREQAGYAPLDTPKPVAEDVFVVDSLLDGPLGLQMPVRMTVIRLPDGTLLLHSPTRFSASLQRALEAIGPIGGLVAPNVAHWMFLPIRRGGRPSRARAGRVEVDLVGARRRTTRGPLLNPSGSAPDEPLSARRRHGEHAVTSARGASAGFSRDMRLNKPAAT